MWKAYVALSAGAALAIAATAASGRAPAVPVVVELFTSEGCSSCPPADDVLARLEAKQPVEGALILPLAFHVDYWDELGWPDPFASPEFTARQRTYASTGSGMYTPQAVVDGRRALVGSDESALEGAIAQAAKTKHTPVAVSARRQGDSIEATARIGESPSGEQERLFFALTQKEVTVRVLRGENGGRVLRHTAVVRDLRDAGAIGRAGGDVVARLRVPKGVSTEALRVVAFVRLASGTGIVGAGTGSVETTR